MRLLVPSVVLAGLVLAPASAMAFVWPWAQPAMPEEAARMVAFDHGIVAITDIDGTMDGDWRVEGQDPWGHEIKLVIDGSTGNIEHAEMDSD